MNTSYKFQGTSLLVSIASILIVSCNGFKSEVKATRNKVAAKSTLSPITKLDLKFSPALNQSYVNALNQSSFTISGSCSSEGSKIVVKTITAKSSVQSLGEAICKSKSWSTQVDLSSLPDGDVTLYLNDTVSSSSSEAPVSLSLIKDTVLPTVVLTTSSATANSSPVLVHAEFSETVKDIDLSKFTTSNVSLSKKSGSGKSYTFNASPDSNGVFTISAKSGLAFDAAGNPSSPSSTLSVNFSSDQPTVVMTSSAGASTSTSPVPLTVTFSAAVTGFTASNISVVNASITGFSGSGTTYTMSLTPAGNGTITADIAAGQVSDAAGNVNFAAAQFSRIYDTVAPSVVISSTASALTNLASIPMTITFSESVTGFSQTGVTVGNGSISGFVGSGTTYTFNVTPTAQGAVTVNIAGSSAQDAAGNNNTAATQYSRTYDSVAPTVVLSTAVASPTNSSSIAVTATFSESVTGFTTSSLSLTNATASGFAGSGTTYTFNLVPTADGTASVSIASSQGSDAAGNGNAASNTLSLVSDRSAPNTPATPTWPSIVSASTSLTASWSAPTDNGSSGVSGTYDVQVGTTAGASDLFNGQVTATSKTVTGVDQASYYVRVRAYDNAGNVSAWSSNSTAISVDNTAPVVGTLSVSGITTTSMNLNWTAATDAVSAQANLQYRVYKSSSNNIDTPSNAVANGTALNAWTTNITTVAVTGLTVHTRYYLNVLVKDEVGNISAYTTMPVSPSPATEWIGNTATLMKFGQGGYPANGRFDGAFENVRSMVAYGGYLYIATATNYAQIAKVDITTGDTVAWVGSVGQVPTGGVAGCTSTAIGAVTPGWCTGGLPYTNSSSYTGMTTDGTNLFYAVSGTIKQRNLSTGALGAVFASPGGTIEQIYYGSEGYIYVANYGAGRIERYDMSGVMQGWIGVVGTTSPTSGAAGCTSTGNGSFTPGWCIGGTTLQSTAATTIGGMYNPRGVVSDGTFIYVSDYGNHILTKYNVSDGQFQGWAGLVGTTVPTGGAAGCTSVAINTNTFTPGWCIGGTNTGGGGTVWPHNGMYWSGHLAYDGTYLFVNSYGQGLVKKIHATTGVLQGFVGRIGSVAASGAAGCTTTPGITPGWCYGGNEAAAVSGWEARNVAAIAVAADGSGNLYTGVANRVDKHTISTGVYVGWLGANASATTTFGTSGYTAGSSYVQTPDSGGLISTAANGALITTSGNNNFGFNYLFDTFTGTQTSSVSLSITNPGTSVTDGTYFYTSMGNSSNAAVYKYGLNGTYYGWVGKIATSPTGGASGCAGAAVGTVTPGWCTGGSASNASTAGGYSSPNVFGIYSGHVYIYDYNNRNMSMINASTGAFEGWIGGIATSPTAGVTGCNGAAVGAWTPGWCLDGTAAGWNATTAIGFTYMNGLGNAVSKNGKILSMFNNRVWKFDALTGAFEGYIGQITGTKPTGGDAGCTTMASNTWTPGWCTGPASMDSNGLIGNSSGGVASDGTYVYLIGNGNSAIAQITRYSLSTGQYQGWRGEISVSPTGGDTGCNGAAVGTVTPGWCTGGTSRAGSQNGAFVTPKTLSLDNMGNLMVGDTGLGRIMKFVVN